jgi:hypothetical protein
VSEREKLKAALDRKIANGLVDIKFHPFPPGLDIEVIAGEVNRMFDAIDAGLAEPFSFNDARWRNSPEG